MKKIVEFTHQAPKEMYYEIEDFKRHFISIWICYRHQFDYNLGKPVRCIWGFYNSKTKCFHSPVNSNTIGKEVDFKQTTSYSAMIPKLTPIQQAFV